jgi:hypothetical protein
MAGERYEAACKAIDAANAEDPRKVDGVAREVLYSERMLEWVGKLAPLGSEELQLAARAQHIRRWTIAREKYPAGKNGYFQWRETLKKFHAETAGAIMARAGYSEAAVGKVRNLIVRKEKAADAEGQVLEDAACLVFLEHEFAEFAGKTDDAKTVDILRKTWHKMSPQAREFALRLPYPPRLKALIDRALSSVKT